MRAVARFIGGHRPDLVVVGGPMANAALSRSPELRDRAVLRASPVSGGPRAMGVVTATGPVRGSVPAAAVGP